MEEKDSGLPDIIGPYKILSRLGKGGMGEVFLGKDPAYGRKLAVKRIRPELQNNKTIQNRFLREANVASSLTHPAIVPILTIQMEPPEVYYTMPCVEGETLRQILRITREQEKNGEPLHPIGKSIPSLARIFLQICQAIAYTHSKGVIHRDLKPENIIVGKYGEVMILDWGIADFIDHLKKNDLPPGENPVFGGDLTRPGKIAGTLAYMPPERLLGKSSCIQTDLYALGVILYQILTLQLPFQRKTIAAFRKMAHTEELPNPIEMAPYRDIPRQLSLVCQRCLAKDIASRYQSVENLIADIKNYIDGKPEWICLGELSLTRKEDWLFQENLLLAKHVAITRSLDITDWAAVMVSRQPFPENLRIEAEIKVKPGTEGIGFLLSSPETDARKSIEEGYCVWIGSQKNPVSRLSRNNVLVLEAKEVFLTANVWHKICIEKIDDHIKLYLNGQLKLHFTSRLPLAGTHVGFIHKDAGFILRKWTLYDGSHTVQVNCLAVPNAFLRHKLYDLALREYRRIGQSFPGRVEGREALFRAGLTLLEKGKSEKQEQFSHLALKEFEKLYRTPGAPLEYLGKSLVYESLNDVEEEAKCLELALRKFPKHPQLPMLKEHIIHRMHESSLNNREAAYRIILLAIRHIPDLLENPDTKMLIHSLQSNWEPLVFIEECQDNLPLIAIQLAFWLKATPILAEMGEAILKKSPVHETLLANIVFCLIELEAYDKAKKFLSLPYPKLNAMQELLKPMYTSKAPAALKKEDFRILHYRMRQALKTKNHRFIEQHAKRLRIEKLGSREKIAMHAIEAWNFLLQKDFAKAEAVFQKAPISSLGQENSPLHFPYGTWLYLQEGPQAAHAHFGNVLDTPYPPTTALPSHYLSNKINDQTGWIQRAFWWEKKELYRQLSLFHQATQERLGETSSDVFQIYRTANPNSKKEKVGVS